MELTAIGNSEVAMLQRMQAHEQILNSPVIENSSHISSTSTSPFLIAAPINSVLDVVNDQQKVASQKVTAIELGQSNDLIGATVANQKASLSFDMLMQVRNKMVSNFNDIFNMSI